MNLIERCAVAATCLGLLVARLAVAAEGDVPAGRYEYTPRALSPIAPGTQIPDGLAESGWNHLLLVSYPRLAAGKIDEIPSTTPHYAELFFTTMAARTDTVVDDSGTRWVLDDVGIALGTRLRGANTIVSVATLQEQRASLGVLGPLALATAEKRIAEVQFVGRSPTMALVDAPAVIVRGDDKHIRCVFRHAVLVDPRNGRLETVFWVIDLRDDGEYLAVRPGSMRLLAPRQEFDNRLRVAAEQFRFSMPEPTAFAMLDLPAGRALAAGDELLELAALPRMSAAVMYHLEVRLWDALYKPDSTSDDQPAN